MSELRELIRSLLQEELARLRDAPSAAPATREERVRIRGDADLGAFARQVLRLARDPQTAADIDSGRMVFRLESGAAPGVDPLSTSGGTGPDFDVGLVTERDVARLDNGVRAIRLGSRARLTPLAKDELRRRGINIVRKAK